MSRTLVIRPEAEDDLAEAKRWYDRRQDGLGTELVERVEDALDTIRKIPLAAAAAFEDTRRVLVRKFPYAVFYRVTDEELFVLAIYHTSRDPRGWQSRT